MTDASDLTRVRITTTEMTTEGHATTSPKQLFTTATTTSAMANQSGSSSSGLMGKDLSSLMIAYRTQFSSAAATVIATASSAPLENVKTRMQSHNFNSIAGCVKYIWHTEGARGFFAGIIPPLFSVTIVRTTNFTVYEKVERFFSDILRGTSKDSVLHPNKTAGQLPTAGNILCWTGAGAVAGFAAAPFACPFELSKNIVQTSVLLANKPGSSNGNNSVRNASRIGTFQAMRQIIARRGFMGLYTGFHLHALRDTIGTAIYFGVFETVKQTVMATKKDSKENAWLPALAGGAFCGGIPWFFTYSLDTRKTRAQAVLLGSGTETLGSSAALGRAAWRGLPVVLVRTAIQNMILFSLFEHFKTKIDELPR